MHCITVITMPKLRWAWEIWTHQKVESMFLSQQTTFNLNLRLTLKRCVLCWANSEEVAGPKHLLSSIHFWEDTCATLFFIKYVPPPPISQHLTNVLCVCVHLASVLRVQRSLPGCSIQLQRALSNVSFVFLTNNQFYSKKETLVPVAILKSFSTTSCGGTDFDALLLLWPLCEQEGLVAVCPLHLQETVGGMSYPRGEHLITQHGVDHWALPVTCPIKQNTLMSEEHLTQV